MTRASAATRQQVLTACLEKGCSPQEAAQRHGVSLRSVRSWLKTATTPPPASPRTTPSTPDKRLQTASRLVGKERDALVTELLEETLRLHVEAVAALASSEVDPLARVEILAKLSQALDRTLRALGKASPELSRLAMAKETLDRMAHFVQERFPQHLPAFVEILEPFASALVAEESRH